VSKNVRYKVTVTRDDFTHSFFTDMAYNKLMETVDILYKHANVDAVELEMISDKEYKEYF